MATKEITLSFETKGGALPPVSFDVSDGKSAYEGWLELPGNAGKTEEEFINSLRGSRTTLVSSTTSPVDLNTLDAGSYYIREEAEGYTILNAPNFFPRTLTIEVDIGPEGTVKIAKAGDTLQMKLGSSFWTIIPSGSQTLLYDTSRLNGLYWSSGTGIYGKHDDGKVLGTADTSSNSLVVKMKNPSSRAGSMSGISQFFNIAGSYKFFVGTESGANNDPSPDKLFTVPTISQADRVKLKLSKVDREAPTLQELAENYNNLVDLLVKSGLGEV